MRTLVVLSFVFQVACAGGMSQAQQAEADAAPILGYIKDGWRTLTRTHKDLVAAAEDPKLTHGAPWLVYAPEGDLEAAGALVRSALGEKSGQIEVRALTGEVTEPGLLYLPNPYVVPGGRFNEMYGWDSYFILLGLLRDNEVDLARGMVENFVYEIDHYGTILNANRTYYLTRSQPPFLTRMVLEIYARTQDRAWLASTMPAIQKYYDFWTTPPHTLPGMGLSRYYDRGVGPAPEVVSGEIENGLSHYERVRNEYKTHPEQVEGYPLADMYDAASDTLLPEFYVGDRSMRESGFDPSGRFGTFNIGATRYAAVCLNSLLWQMERDTADIAEIVGTDPTPWRTLADQRRAAIDGALWDDGRGLYFDADITSGQRRDYPFATTFFPLWTGVASQSQADRVVENLKIFERAGGIVTSPKNTGAQWDAPFGWAPLQIVAIEGLRRYGYIAEADRLSIAFLSLVLQEFREHDAIFEKYDVEARDSAVAANVKFGYSANVIGFGWTNAAWTTLWDKLGVGAKKKVIAAAASTN